MLEHKKIIKLGKSAQVIKNLKMYKDQAEESSRIQY